ncbi:hypothetical protein [Nocardioides sp.]|uniref:hypothetical protein n=1 Tax=Nocardioides sp. TaxID=35761 RepID=UPI0035654023
MIPSTTRRLFVLATTLALLITGAFAVVQLRGDRSAGGAQAATSAAGPCLRGYQPVLKALSEVRAEMRNEGKDLESSDPEVQRQFEREAVRELPMLEGTDPADWAGLCVIGRRPESFKELNAMFDTRAVPANAPYGSYQPGAALNAAKEAAALKPVAGTKGKGRLYGKGPLIVDSPDYPEVNGLGLHDNSGRVDDYAYDAKHKRLFAAVASGGIWRSDNLGKTWKYANGNMPTTVTGAVAYTNAKSGKGKKGTLIALTGEPTFGASAYTGLGAYWSSDLGKHWHRAKGIPAGVLGFALAVDPQRKRRVYAGTQIGLFVSTDAGRSFRNARLPSDRACVGIKNFKRKPQCALRNVVTDVVVSKKGGVGTSTKPGTVVATIGWRGGDRKNLNGTRQSIRNGIYRSTSGNPNTFKRVATSGFAANDAIGRVELGEATGPKQDHDYLYAMVQDANLLNNGGISGIDVPSGTSPIGTTVFNGMYVSDDFGTTWTKMVSGSTLATDPLSGSALFGTGTALGFQPGVQGWYNLWVKPDPTRATAAGVPTRLAFGLEEIWTNENANLGAPLDGSVPTHFVVAAKYFGGDSCLLLSAGLPACPGDRDPLDDNTTTHPDQQDGIWIPDSSVAGGVQLVVGNDGGAYRYRFENDSDGELDNSHWGDGDQDGFSTLLPYFAAMANDGTVYGGLQDNGNLKIDGKTRKQYETYGGDGFFSAVDPHDSKITYEEYTNAAMSVSTDGGTSWSDMDPGLTASKFSNPFVMDPTDAKHLLTAGREVVETLIGPATTAGMTDAADADEGTSTWIKVFDLGTKSKPGVASATSSAADPDNSMSAVATRGNASYVGFCGQCDTLNKLSSNRAVFKNGLATNVGKVPGKAGTSQGWHVVKAKGLPNRYITSIAIDPKRKKRIYVTLGGYTRRWVPAGAVGDVNAQLGKGNLYLSNNGGKTFKNVSGNLPDTPANWVALRGKQLLVATDVGVFASTPKGVKQKVKKKGKIKRQPKFGPLRGVPRAPATSISLKPDNPNLAVMSMFGRGVWTYAFKNKVKLPAAPSAPTAPVLGTTIASYNFEAGAQGWTTSAPPSWTRGTPGHGSGTAEAAAGSSFGVTGPLGYIDAMDATVTSPSITVPAGASVVQWSMKMDTESYDKVNVEWSKNGSTWQALGSYAGQNAGYPGWTKYSLPLQAPGGGIQVRFHFVSDAFCAGLPTGGPLCEDTNGYDGVRIDDVVVGRAK